MTETLAAHPGIKELIHRQAGLLSSAQARAHGVPHETLRRRVLRGIWQRLLPGVYALQCGPPTVRQWWLAALLYAGEGSMLTGRAALAAHRLGGTLTGPPAPPDERIEVLIPHAVRRQNTDRVRVIRTARLPEPVEHRGLRLAPPARAAVDACLAAVERDDPAAADAIAAAALADGRVGLDLLEQELDRAPRRHSGRLREQLARRREEERREATAGLRRALRAAGPCGALEDVAVYAGARRVAGVAALWPRRAVVAAVDAPDHEIRSLTELGFAVVPVAPRRVAEDPEGVLHRLGAVLGGRPETALPAGVCVLPGARGRPGGGGGPGARGSRPPQRVRTANSPARTGTVNVLPRGGTGQT